MTKPARALMAAAALSLAGAFAFPLWRITLVAPQYPEGLGMLIRVSTLTGVKEHDLTNINELNHYIGMKLIDAAAIPELRFMPWVLGALAVGAVLVAGAGRLRGLVCWLVAIAVAGGAGLIDFWRWNYDYGHHLDFAHAIIKVPGTVYQPPLLGVRQILSFSASSWPDVGGALAGLAFLCGAAAVVVSVRARRAAPLPSASAPSVPHAADAQGAVRRSAA